MSRIFTVVGHLTEEGEPTVVAVIEGQDYVVGGPVQRKEWGVWSWTGDAVDMEAAESLAYEKILADVSEDVRYLEGDEDDQEPEQPYHEYLYEQTPEGHRLDCM